LWTFEPNTSSWREAGASNEGPEPRFGHVAVYDTATARLIIALGQGAGSKFFNDVWAFDGSRWERLMETGDAPEVRYGAGGAHEVSTNRLLISHGFTDRGRYDDSWALDLGDRSWSKIKTSGDVPIKRCLTRCAFSQASMLLFGGQTDDTPFLGDFWRLNLSDGRWQQLSPPTLPSARNLFAAALDPLTGHWYLTSGNTPDGPTADTWTFDLVSETWSSVAVTLSPPARFSADAAIAGRQVYMFGGHDGEAELNDLWVLSI
jgi:hypothetical protein